MPKEEDSSKSLTQLVSLCHRCDPPMGFFFFLSFFFSKFAHGTCFSMSPAPLKGIPKAPFRSPTAPSMFSPPSNRTPIAPARTPLRKERGVKVLLRFHADLWFFFFFYIAKIRTFVEMAPRSPSFQLLDISELDMVGAGREAKRRRKTLGEDFPSFCPCSQPPAGLQKAIASQIFNVFSSFRNGDGRETHQRRGCGGEHHPRLRCWPRLHTGNPRTPPLLSNTVFSGLYGALKILSISPKSSVFLRILFINSGCIY